MSAARIIAAMSGFDAARFVSENHYPITTGSVAASFSGAQAGYLALLFGYATTSTPPAGWTTVVNDSQTFSALVFSKVLTAGDVSAGSVTLTGSNGGVVAIAFYRRATTATLRSSAKGNVTSLTTSGFTKAVTTKGLITFLMSADGASVPAAPSGATTRVVYASGSNTPFGLADYLLGVGNTNTPSLTWTGLALNGGSIGGVIELT